MDADESSITDGRQRKYQAAGLLAAGYVSIPNLVVRHEGLSGNAKAMWAIVYDLVHFRDEEPELVELGVLIGGGEKAARAALRELQDIGLVYSKRRGRGLSNQYVLTDPPAPQTGPEGGSTTALRAAPPFKHPSEDTPAEIKPSAGGRVRSRNIVFDALAEATSENPDASGGKIAKALKAIRAAEAPVIVAHAQTFLAENPGYDEVPPERVDQYLAAKIRARAQRYREMRPDWELTSTALATHWLRIATWTPDRGGALSPSELATIDLGDQ